MFELVFSKHQFNADWLNLELSNEQFLVLWKVFKRSTALSERLFPVVYISFGSKENSHRIERVTQEGVK